MLLNIQMVDHHISRSSGTPLYFIDIPGHANPQWAIKRRLLSVSFKFG